jgi:putative phosphoesterase
MQTRTAPSEPFENAPGYCLLGADTLLDQIKQLENQIEGAKRNEDIEYIHKLRVASRRVRTALSIFKECFPAKQSKEWRRMIKNLTVSSGAARDTDVLISFLGNYSTHANSRAARGLKVLIANQKARRTIMQSQVVKTLDSLEVSHTLADISHSCKTMRISENEDSSIKTLPTYEKARDHIGVRLDELLILGQFVHDRSAAAKHHELRIAAKRLRYTMEIFSVIYKHGLRDQIALTKQFQDVLGKMHDYYVWAQDLSAQRQKIPVYAKYGLDMLLASLRKERKSRYRDFVSLWDNAENNNLLAKIRELTDTGPNSEIIHERLNIGRKVALISDIHGNFDALKAVVKDAKNSGLEIFLNAGDAVGFGIHPSQVVQALRSPMFLSVVGNVDLEVLEALRHSKSTTRKETEELALTELSPSNVAYLQSLPKELRLQMMGTNVLVTHGSPDSIEEHIYPDSPEERLRQIAANSSANVIVTGHTHQQMNRNVNGVTFVNPGSVGRPADGDPKAEYAVLRFSPLDIEFRRVNYQVEALADEMRKRAIPESHVQALLRGIDLESVRKQEDALAKKRLWKNPATMGNVRSVTTKYSGLSHAEQARKLALRIFDSTKQLHLLSSEERFWLECAAILHEIGLSRGKKGYQKSSLRLILNDTDLPFTQRERYIIGSVARYHRKATPDTKHFNLIPLTETEKRKVAVLSSVLRLADALDCSHRSVVKKVTVKPFQNHMVLECVVSARHYLEAQSAMKKKDLFEKVFKTELAIVWKSRPAKGKRSPSPETQSSKARPISQFSSQTLRGEN